MLVVLNLLGVCNTWDIFLVFGFFPLFFNILFWECGLNWTGELGLWMLDLCSGTTLKRENNVYIFHFFTARTLTKIEVLTLLVKSNIVKTCVCFSASLFHMFLF